MKNLKILYLEVKKLGEQCVLTHDIGTSGDKATLVSTSGKILGVAEKDYDVNYPHPGWAEQNPKQYWDAVVETTRALLKKTEINPKDVNRNKSGCPNDGRNTCRQRW
jgi:glycerol kinase